MRNKLRKSVTKTAEVLEVCVAVLIAAAILIGGFFLVRDTVSILLSNHRSFSMSEFFGNSLLLIMGIEFIKMLVLHTPRAVIEVLLFAIAREMIVTHTSPFETLAGVIAVAVIFAVRKYFYVAEFDDTDEKKEQSKSE